MGNIIGILVGSDLNGKIPHYAIGVDENSVLLLTQDINKARRFDTVEEARSVFTTSTIKFCRFEDN